MRPPEVKYDEYLPDFIRQALQIVSLDKTSFSKYYLCRLTTAVLWQAQTVQEPFFRYDKRFPALLRAELFPSPAVSDHSFLF